MHQGPSEMSLAPVSCDGPAPCSSIIALGSCVREQFALLAESATNFHCRLRALSPASRSLFRLENIIPADPSTHSLSFLAPSTLLFLRILEPNTSYQSYCWTFREVGPASWRSALRNSVVCVLCCNRCQATLQTGRTPMSAIYCGPWA